MSASANAVESQSRTGSERKDQPHLFRSFRLRSVTVPNRIMLSPMNQHSARDGLVDDWQLVHFGKFALGGFGIVSTEATAVEIRGRIAPGDLGIWSDDHIPGLKRITDFLRANGSVPAMQLGHSGRKGAARRPWHGLGPLTEADAANGEPAWTLVSPTSEPLGPGCMQPDSLSKAGIDEVVESFATAAARADAAGFDMVEIHGGHGYLIASFLSPIINTRSDGYGGDLAGRMRFALDVVRAVRSRWPETKPLAFRLSSVDGHAKGWQIEDSVALARELRGCGVDVIDCSSGGLRGSTALENADRLPGYQVEYAERIRREAGIATIAVGLIMDPQQAEDIVRKKQADVVALGRQALYDPYWPRHAAHALGSNVCFREWPRQSGWWLQRRASDLANIGYDPAGRSQPTSRT